MEVPDEELKEITHGLVLNAFSCISKETNYQMLKSEPTSTKLLMERFDLAKTAVDRRLNELESAGLIKRNRRDEDTPYKVTRLGELTVKLVDEIEVEAMKMIPELLKGCTVRSMYREPRQF